MKKILFALGIVLVNLTTFSQDFRGTPVANVTPIQRTIDNSQYKSPNLQQELSNQIIPAAKTAGTPTGNSAEVGITEGQLSVSLSGAANYSIPIAVPPGINGLVPQISLTYSSQGGNGMAGYGWNISGVSSITRIPSTMFHDGIIDPVDFDSLDRFAFDGQRLLLKDPTQTYGASGTVYETENFSNLKITAVGGTNNNPTSFNVEYPDGSVASYATTTPTNWAITYWQNPQGVRISYAYLLEDNVLYITKISYGATFTNTPINEINFLLEVKDRPEQAYIGGISFISKYVIRTIRVKANGLGFRSYHLLFDSTSLGYTRLLSITEKTDNDLLNYNPTVFRYDTTTNATLFETYPTSTVPFWTGLNNQNSTVVNGDFDADGKSDMIIYATDAAAKNQYTLVTNLTGNNSNNATQNSTVGNFETIFPVTYTNFTNKIFPNQGWCVVKKNGSTYSFQTHNSVIGVTSFPPLYFQIPMIVAFPTVLIDRAHPTLNCTNNSEYILQDKKILSGDFNGDGVTDVIAINQSYSYQTWIDTSSPGTGGSCYKYTTQYPGGSTYYIDLKTGAVGPYTLESIGSIGNVDNSTNIQVVDFNGDAKSDLMVLRAGNLQFYSLDENNQLVQIYNFSEPGLKTDKPLLIGDYNGDGKTDFCIPQQENQDSWNFYFSNGIGFDGKNGAIGINYFSSVCNFNDLFMENYYLSSDFNNDGKTDIMAVRHRTSLNPSNPCEPYYANTQSVITRLVLAQNIAANQNQIVFSTTFNGSNDNYNLKRYPIIAMLDHNNPRNKAEFSLIQGNKIVTFRQPKDSAIDMLLRKITTGNGVEETISYKPLKEENVNAYDYNNPNLYYSNGNLLESYPNIDIIAAPSFKVVSKLEKQSSNVYKKQFFTYAGAVSNVSGLGFMGFRGTMRTNWHDGIAPNYLISSVSINDISLRGANIENFSAANLWKANSTSPSSGFISKSKNTYNVGIPIYGAPFTLPPLLTNKVYKLFVGKSEQFNGLDNTKSITDNLFDVYNNPTKSTTTLFNGTVNEQGTTTLITYDNQPLATTRYIGRPISKLSAIVLNLPILNSDVSNTLEQYTYTNHLLTQVKKRSTNSGQTTNFLTEDNGYDPLGNITKKTITATGLTQRVTNYQYDLTFPLNGRFLTKSFDIEGLMTEYNYNPSNGLLNWEKNPYLLQTSYTYDKWFKKTKVTDYLGKNKNFVYTKSNTTTQINTTADDNSATEERFDDLGRKILSVNKDINNSFVAVDYLYDIYDRNYKTSEPYFAFNVNTGTYGLPLQWNETKYDSYGRPIRTDSFTGKFGTIDYNGLTTTVAENVTLPTPMIVKSKASTKNAMGKVISMTETLGGVAGGTISYSYFANGNLKTTEFGGATTTITQDGWGRKKQLDDSSAGTYQYTYNDFGETLTETVRAAGTTTTPGAIKGITTYTIDDVGKVSQKTIIGQNGDATNSKTTYTYDGTSKLLSKMRFDDITAGNYTIYNYGYDANKRPNFNDESGFFAYYQQAKEYDACGRVSRELFTAINTSDSKRSDKWVRYTYKNGYQWQIIDDATNKVLREINSVNARGQLLIARSGAITYDRYTYDIFGLQTNKSLWEYSTGGTLLFNLDTSFDPQRGNLKSRSNPFTNATESFTYDNQDRLLTYPNELGVTQTQGYDVAGKITANNIGDYAYSNTAKPYQLTSITPNDQSATSAVLNYYTNRNQDIKYNVFKSPVSIMEQGKENIFFEYNAFNQRSTMYCGGLQTDKTLLPVRKFYNADGSMEIKRILPSSGNPGYVEFTTFIGGDAYNAPIMLKSDGTTQNYLYLHRDYQGSIIAVTNDAGKVLQKQFFDPWGKMSNYLSYVCLTPGCPTITYIPTNNNDLRYTDRGYTGHEMLLGVGLINMNARLYDPKLHRFLEPDNFVQDPSNTQSFNRYGYCWNNPLAHTDPSGEWIWIVAAAVIGGVINWGVHGFRTDIEGLKAFGIGAAAGTIGALTGGAAFAAAGGAAGGVGGVLAGAAGGAVGSATSSIFLSGANNIAFGDPLMSGKEFITGIAFGALLGGATNGIAALRNGKSFWNGTTPRVEASVIAKLNPTGISGGQTELPKSNVSRIPNATQTNTAPTTQANTVKNINVENGGVSNLKCNNCGYPPNNGSVPGTTNVEYLQKGTLIDRFGTTAGKFGSPAGTPLEMRSLPPSNSGVLNTYEVVKPFYVESSLIQPYYGQPGMGVQYRFPATFEFMLQNGFIK